MESAGFITLAYIMYALPKELEIKELPWGNWTMAACFVRLFLRSTHSIPC
jgi:3-oxo-5-alpha-steroid 4-dehydrogenase 1